MHLLIWGTPAGRGAKEANLYTEIAEGIHSYGVTRHRHGKDSRAKPCYIFYYVVLLNLLHVLEPPFVNFAINTYVFYKFYGVFPISFAQVVA